MNLDNIKLSLLRDNNQAGIKIIEKIQNLVKAYNISINKAITYCLSNCKTPYQDRLLKICRAIYPYDGQIELSSLINNVPISKSNINKLYYKVGKYSQSNTRQIHEEDNIIKNMPIGISQDKIYNTISVKKPNNQVLAEIITTDILSSVNIQKNKIDKQKKPKRKRKARIN